jgi:hypothetical protein
LHFHGGLTKTSSAERLLRAVSAKYLKLFLERSRDCPCPLQDDTVNRRTP